jgi:hypothetical protein
MLLERSSLGGSWRRKAFDYEPPYVVLKALLLLLVRNLLAVGEHGYESYGKISVALAVAIPIACLARKTPATAAKARAAPRWAETLL